MVYPLTVYKASAGSGKTFRLAIEYIKLVVRNPQSYRNILAVTFTNKATEEMKMRILSQLYGLWKMPGREEQFTESKPYMNELCLALDASPAFISQRAGMALTNLLHNYNYFRVQTIDTFFQSVLRNLARELDLSPNLRIGLNDQQVEELAVDELIADLQTTDTVLQWIMKYIMESISDDRSWNVIGQIKQFGKTIFRDYYKAGSKTLNLRLAEPGFFDGYTRHLRLLRNTARERMTSLGQQFFDVLKDNQLSVNDLSNKDRGIASFFNKLRAGTFDASIINKTVDNCLDDAAKWYTKTHQRREEIHQLVDSVLMPLLRTAVDEQPRQWRLYQSAELTLRHLNQLRLLSSIETKVRELNETANRFLLSDTQQLLSDLISNSDTPFIFEKIGTQLDHVMIDEFQDTSTLQWRNFRVLLLETMSRQGSENLIVGDVKQSIYRWRSGDWRLLNNIEEQFAEGMVTTKTLDMNRRSCRRIVDFNSQFFHMAEALERQLLGNAPEAQQLARAYTDVVQKVPQERPDSGMVSIRLMKSNDYQELTLSETVNIVSRLLSLGIPQQKIAILVRTNKLIPLIANYFAEQMPQVSIISDEAFRLDASTAVCIIVKALHLLIHPADTLARAYLEKVLPEGLPEAYTAHTDELLMLPLYELVERLFVVFNLNRFDEQTAYVCTFYDYLSDYINDNTPDIDGFLRQWEESIGAKTIQSDVADGIRLISIHKSKGLEFDHVIIPFCDWQLEKQSGNILWCQPAEPPFSDLSIVPIDYSRKGMTGTIYENDYHEEHLQNVVDNLNLLYVAFTRARNSLFVLGRRGTSSSRSAIIEQTLPLLNNDILPGAVVSGTDTPDADMTFDYGTLDAWKAPDEKATDEANVFLKKAMPLPVTISSFDNKVEFRQSNSSRQFVGGTDDTDEANDYIQIGSVLHTIFSTIRTTADIGPALARLEMEGVLDSPTITSRITTLLRRRLEHPKVADWFSPRWTLFNECTILEMKDGVVTEHRPDRIMTDGQEWIVVDFKFGNPDNDHHKQVRRYMHLLRQMGHQHISGYLWYVYTNRIENVKETENNENIS